MLARQLVAQHEMSGDAFDKDEILQVLRSMDIEAVTSRPNVAHCHGQQVESACIGLSARHGQLTFMTMQAANVFSLPTMWLRSQSRWREFDFTSVTINRNHAAALHRDSGNLGPSVIVTLGEYSGGELRTFPGDDGFANPASFAWDDGLVVQTNDFEVFDGNVLHGNSPFLGERMSVIYFMSSQVDHADDDAISWLRSRGAFLS